LRQTESAFGFELAVEPLSALPAPPPCEESAAPDLLLSPGGYGDIQATALVAAPRPIVRPVVASVRALTLQQITRYTFEVRERSLLTAQTTSRFTTADVALRLDAAALVLQPGTAFPHTIVATAARDRTDLRTVRCRWSAQVCVAYPSRRSLCPAHTT
jgi:hypothetical protein